MDEDESAVTTIPFTVEREGVLGVPSYIDARAVQSPETELRCTPSMKKARDV